MVPGNGYCRVMTNDRVQAFADALNSLESDGDVDGFVDKVFSSDVELLRPETEQQVSGRSGAVEFWSQYLAQFDEIRSTFSRVVDSGELGVLEWSSTGRLAGAGTVEYRGISVLDFDDAGRVRRLCAYFDTHALQSAATKSA